MEYSNCSLLEWEGSNNNSYLNHTKFKGRVLVVVSV